MGKRPELERSGFFYLRDSCAIVVSLVLNNKQEVM